MNDVERLFSKVDRVSVYEVSLRDGLQNEKTMVPTPGKLRLIEALVEAGLERIEATSFVSPKWIPQLADADEVVQHLPRSVPPARPVTFSALCPNPKGLERARAAQLEEVAVFLSASETHTKKNINKTIAEALAEIDLMVPQATTAGMRVRGYVSTVWGCPYEGAVDVERAHAIALHLIELGCYQVSLGDTIGCGTPLQTSKIVERMLVDIPAPKLALHMHDTRGTAQANILVGLMLGIRDFDAAVGGLGGCPYAPGAAGNMATEDLVYMLHGMGIETGIDLEKLIVAGNVAEGIVGRPLPGKVHQSGLRGVRA